MDQLPQEVTNTLLHNFMETIETLNRMIHQWFPKGMNFRELLDYEVQSFGDKPNNRPRKSLGYRTPKEVLFNFKI